MLKISKQSNNSIKYKEPSNLDFNMMMIRKPNIDIPRTFNCDDLYSS
jgi:hypothetical protein